jgi:spermidine/putrescine transport system ATP-binding protein
MIPVSPIQQEAEKETRRVADASTEPVVYDVEVRNLVHYYGSTHVLDDVSLKVMKGEFFGILGPSGSGKTTTLRIIGGFVTPTSGDVYIQGQVVTSLPPYRRDTTMVFQHLALFPHLNVFNNLAYGLKLRRRPQAEIEERVARTLRLVKLEGLERRYPKQLSGGQQQRVALARSIILEPSVVLFDEPLGSLDLKLRREMQVELKSLQKVVGTTFIYVTHDQEEALTMSDRIAVMSEGRIEQIGTAEEVYEHPQTRFVAAFIGDTNLLEGAVTATSGGEVAVQAQGLELSARAETPLAAGDLVAVSIRPERITLSAERDETAGHAYLASVVDIIYTGSRRRYVVRLENGLELKVDSHSVTAADWAVGNGVWASWSAQDAHGVR